MNYRVDDKVDVEILQLGAIYLSKKSGNRQYRIYAVRSIMDFFFSHFFEALDVTFSEHQKMYYGSDFWTEE